MYKYTSNGKSEARNFEENGHPGTVEPKCENWWNRGLGDEHEEVQSETRVQGLAFCNRTWESAYSHFERIKL